MKSNCDSCVHYVYDEDYECFLCESDLDEDEMGKFLSSSFENCPFYRLDDEYGVVKHQL